MTQQATTQAIERRPVNAVIGLNMRDLNDAAALIFDSKVFGDLASREAAAIKIIAGAEKGFTPFQSMSMFDFIQGRPTLNAHGKATLINSSGDFRLKIKELTATTCVIDVLRISNGEWKVINTSSFTIDDAKMAELTTGKNAHSWKKYPRNMLFARCVSNIWRWDCAELNTRKISPDQINEFTADELAEDDRDVIDGEIVMDGETVDTSTGEVIEADVVAETAIDPAESKLADLFEAALARYNDCKDDERTRANKWLGSKTIRQLDAEGLTAFLAEFPA